MFKREDRFINKVQYNVKDIFSKIKDYDSRHPSYIYILLGVLGLLVIIHPFGDESIVNFFKVYFKKKQLTEELMVVQNKYKSDSIRLHQLKNDANALERVAREDYLMKSPNEIIFVVKKTNKDEK